MLGRWINKFFTIYCPRFRHGPSVYGSLIVSIVQGAFNNESVFRNKLSLKRTHRQSPYVLFRARVHSRNSDAKVSASRLSGASDSILCRRKYNFGASLCSGRDILITGAPLDRFGIPRWDFIPYAHALNYAQPSDKEGGSARGRLRKYSFPRGRTDI